MQNPGGDPSPCCNQTCNKLEIKSLPSMSLWFLWECLQLPVLTTSDRGDLKDLLTAYVQTTVIFHRYNPGGDPSTCCDQTSNKPETQPVLSVALWLIWKFSQLPVLTIRWSNKSEGLLGWMCPNNRNHPVIFHMRNPGGDPPSCCNQTSNTPETKWPLSVASWLLCEFLQLPVLTTRWSRESEGLVDWNCL